MISAKNYDVMNDFLLKGNWTVLETQIPTIPDVGTRGDISKKL